MKKASERALFWFEPKKTGQFSYSNFSEWLKKKLPGKIPGSNLMAF